jgi:hypothetical protein
VLTSKIEERTVSLTTRPRSNGAGGSSSGSRCSSCCLCGRGGGFLDEFCVSRSVKYGEDTVVDVVATFEVEVLA